MTLFFKMMFETSYVLYIAFHMLQSMVGCKQHSWSVVCISGVTCGGKSTVTRSLHKQYEGSVLLKQDSYYLDDNDPRHVQLPELKWRNRELISSLDMERMGKDVQNVISRKNAPLPLLFLDGFMLYYDKNITSQCDLKFFFVLEKNACKIRRTKRNRSVPNIERYFDEYVWPAHVEYKEAIFREIPDLILIDGSANNATIIQDMSAKIDQIIKSKNN